MIIRHISIQHLGAVDHFSCDLSDRLNLVKTRETKEVSFAIRLILNQKDPLPWPAAWIREDTQIEAAVKLQEGHYRVIAHPDRKSRSMVLFAFDDKGKDATQDYRYLTAHCLEQDLSDAFEGDERADLGGVVRYANEEQYYAPRELSGRTDGFSNLKAFRGYLRSFIQNFEPEPIRPGKPYELILEDGGRYGVRHKEDVSLPAFLSESERTLFRYLCFLRTAEFWHGFEEMRNLHSVKKPLLVQDFLERLDESVDIRSMIKRTLQLKRQVILLTTPSAADMKGELWATFPKQI